MVLSPICKLDKLQNRPFRHILQIAAMLAVIVFGLMLHGCAPANLSNVLIGDRVANPGEYYQVQVFQKEKPVQTLPGMDLKLDSVIETDDQSWAVITFTNGPRVIMKPGTRGRISSFQIDFGEILVIIEKLKGVFEVKTEDVVAGPESTIFAVSKAPGGPSVVSVIRGAVKLTSPASVWTAVTIKQNQRASIAYGKPPKSGILPHEAFNDIISWANRVELAISPAQANVIVPNVGSLPQEAARRLLEGAGLRIGKITPKVTASRPPLGTVVEQQPAPGTYVRKGTAVHIGVEVEPVRMPRLINEHFEKAKDLISRIGLKLGTVDRRITGNAPAETVIEQHPGSDVDVPKGSTVSLVVEEESVLVPNLQGLNRTTAQSTLANARLLVERWDEEITGSQPPHTVLRQYPGPNERVRPQTGVTLVLEAISVVVPNLIGNHRNNAAVILGQNQLSQGGVFEQITGSQPAGVIFHQDPPAGQRVRPGTQVNLHVEALSILVPNIVGLVINAASNTLLSNSLRVGRVTEELLDNVNDGTVLRQAPPPGQRVAPQTAIEIVIAVRGSRIPNLNGQTQQSAQTILYQNGLSMGGVSQQESRNAAPGRIIYQNPQPGALVRRGTRVDIVLATPPSCIVPNVMGRNVVDAYNIIRGAGFVPINQNPNVTGYNTKVLDQFPVGNARAVCGSQVRFTALPIVQ
ncbi:MAG: PASTA domain-containing protein [Desulfobacteraceae bacterium]|jgi:beta-lactam-binding protein with PASTA domain|nr:PASTA domain-containing protein [Desulfobacteraceae bacterium]